MILKSISFWLYLIVSSALLFPVACVLWLLTTLFDPKLTLLHRFTCWWGSHYIRYFPFWRLRIHDVYRIDHDKPQIILANHQSMGDILALFALRKNFKWVAKRSLFRIPFIGWNMSLNHYVPLDRANPGSMKRMMRACKTHLKNGSSLLLFPEGTRSSDGELKDFKSGAFRLACQLQIPVVPVVIDGTFEALPKSGWIFKNRRPLNINMQVLEPIEPSDCDYNAGKLSRYVQHIMKEKLFQMRHLPAQVIIFMISVIKITGIYYLQLS